MFRTADVDGSVESLAAVDVRRPDKGGDIHAARIDGRRTSTQTVGGFRRFLFSREERGFTDNPAFYGHGPSRRGVEAVPGRCAVPEVKGAISVEERIRGGGRDKASLARQGFVIGDCAINQNGVRHDGTARGPARGVELVPF